MGLLFWGFVVRTQWASYDEPKEKCQSGFIQNDNRIALRLSPILFCCTKMDYLSVFLCLGNLQVPSAAVGFHFFVMLIKKKFLTDKSDYINFHYTFSLH